MTDVRLEKMEAIDVAGVRTALDDRRILYSVGFGVAHGIVFTRCAQ